MTRLSPLIRSLLACPACLGPLTIDPGQARCDLCACMYPSAPDGRFDLRPQKAKICTADFVIAGNAIRERIDEIFRPIRPNPSPQFDYRSIPIPSRLCHGNRITRELLSYFPHSARGGAMLDLGCGTQEFKPLCACTGLEYVGIDSQGTAMFLGDAHALPFADSSFDFIISFAVLEHVRFPAVVLREARRVLKPGCLFIGTVAFLEPWHLDSLHHSSPFGIHDLLASSGFEIRQIESNRFRHGLRAQACMSLFPGAPRLLSDALVLPLLLLSRLWWRVRRLADHGGNFGGRTRQLVNAGGFRFVASKPASP
jgi:SAM-dependent methyltransferase